MQIIELTILDILVLFGALQGFILAYILLTTRRLNKISNKFFALLLVTLSLLNLTSVLESSPQLDSHLWVNYMPCFWATLIPPCIFFFLKYLIDANYQWQKRDYLFFLPFAIELSHRLYRFGRFLAGQLYSDAENMSYYFISNTYEVIAVVATSIVIIYGIIKLKEYEERLYQNYAEVKDKSLAWLRLTLIMGLVLAAVWGFVAITDYRYERQGLYDPLAMSLLLGLSLLIYWIGYSMIIRQDLLDTPVFAISEITTQSTVSNNELSIKTDEHFVRIKNLMTEKELFKNPNLNMSILSEATGLSNSYLSQIINQKDGQNFFDFVNGYRVEDVKIKMSDPSFEHYTILGLAQEAGFKSKSTFNAVFKKMTGKTPSEFKKSSA